MLKIYTKSDCPNCVTAKNLCALRGLSYIEVHLGTPEALAHFKAQYPTARSLPFICDDSGVIGGITAFKAWAKSHGA